jgi:carbon monoxide dehydrogenase subunit G
MTEGKVEFHVRRPPEEVFAALADLEQAPRWVPDLVSVEKQTPGPVGVGTRYSEVVRMGEKVSEAELEVTEHDPPRVFAHRGQGGPARFTARFTLTPDGEGTRVAHAYTVQLSGFAKLLTPVVARWIRKNAETAAEGLRRSLEDG